ncbi:Hpt domain-containing protein [Roseibium sp. RKSG952]|uniref:Hpt domain-containing protein n=1 Tax=Roseibium sp. RKSG952 TaxID=2529384 RepID=UPI0018AD1174|nr:Hpt domain-containing protein [Roseibium sp. RKSG952]
MGHRSLLPDKRAVEQGNPIDLQGLQTSTMGNRDLEVQVLKLFLTQSRAALDQLGRVTCLDEAKVILHTLKGSAQAVGAKQIADVCADLEQSAGQGRHLELEELRECVADACVFIEDRLNSGSQ